MHNNIHNILHYIGFFAPFPVAMGRKKSHRLSVNVWGTRPQRPVSAAWASEISGRYENW